MRLMKYVENANQNDATAAITVGDDRPTIYMGGYGEMTDREISNAISMGHVLVEVDDGGLSKMTVAQLDSKAEKLGVEFGEDDDKEAKTSKLRARLASGPEDTAAAAIGGSSSAGTSATIAPAPATSSTGTATT